MLAVESHGSLLPRGRIVVADIRQEPKSDEHPTHELIEDETDQHAVFVKCDVSSPDAFDPVMAAAEELGGLDIMVNNAGIWRPEEFLEVTEEEYTQLMDINIASCPLWLKRPVADT